MYHYIRVNPDPDDFAGYILSVTPDDFAAQVEFLTARGYHTVSFAQLVAYFDDQQPLPSQPIILTFDDGYRDFYTEAYPILKKYGQTATVFLITGFLDWPGYLTTEQIEEMAADGIDFGGHTTHHIDVRAIDEAQAAEEIVANKRDIEAILGREIVAFSYPGGGFSDWAAGLVQAAGYQAAVTTRYGLWHTQADLLSLSRLRISGMANLAFLAGQLGEMPDAD
ncbi:MAG: polysaccharide deacetylase family protein [Chloroflexi bacterium]|nr:polysaccharide deacetylase family protein [Chloroflexota bacterium]